MKWRHKMCNATVTTTLQNNVSDDDVTALSLPVWISPRVKLPVGSVRVQQNVLGYVKRYTVAQSKLAHGIMHLTFGR
jgi:hypothetical protein